MYIVYIIYSEKFDRYYVGSTQDVGSRLQRHNNKMVHSTRAYCPWLLVYTEHFDTRALAIKREIEIKKKKSRKYIQQLISGY